MRANLLRFAGYDYCRACSRLRRVCCDYSYRGEGLPYDHEEPVCATCCHNTPTGHRSRALEVVEA